MNGPELQKTDATVKAKGEDAVTSVSAFVGGSASCSRKTASACLESGSKAPAEAMFFPKYGCAMTLPEIAT